MPSQSPIPSGYSEENSPSTPVQSGWVDNPRINRSISCVELDSEQKIKNDSREREATPPIPNSEPPPRPKSDNIFLEIGSVFSRGGSSRKRNKDLKLNLNLANGYANPLRASKSNLDLTRLSSGDGNSNTITSDFPLHKKSPTKRNLSSITSSTGTESGYVFGLKRRDYKNKKKSKDLASSTGKREVS